MENRDIYNSVVSKVATLQPIFAKSLVDMALKAQGVDRYSFSPAQLLNAIEHYIDPRLCQHLGHECSVLTAGTGMIIANDSDTIIKMDPLITNMLGNYLDNSTTGKEQFSQLNSMGILPSYKVVRHLDSSEKYIPQINRYLNVICIKDEEARQMMAIIQDVTIQKHLEQCIRDYSIELEKTKNEVNLAYKQALEASRAKSEFLSHMSHELRTPLNGILGFAQILEMDGEDSLTEMQLSNVKDIISAGNHLLALINEVLDLAKIEKGKLDLMMEQTSLQNIIADSLSLMEPIARKRQIKVTNRVSDNGYMISADQKRLKQVFLNLLSNAVKYNRDNGEITVSCNLIDTQRIRINIKDTGAGLSQEQLEKLFIPFERVHKHDHVDGAGIGLAISKRLVELMGGRMGVDSKVDEGSTFWLELNLAS